MLHISFQYGECSHMGCDRMQTPTGVNQPAFMISLDNENAKKELSCQNHAMMLE